MGEVTAASILYQDGTTRTVEELKQIEERSYEDGRIELFYAYGPHLLPPLEPSNDGIWRYQALLPLPLTERRYPLAVGGTPLLASPGLCAWTNLPQLWIKDETRSPTGSNKDRATALVLEHALRQGVTTVSCASTGNVALSLAVGAAAACLQAIIFVPSQVSDAKLQLSLQAGATVFKVEEGYEAAVKLSRQAAHAFGWYDRNTGYNPLTLEAKKTVALEIWEQLGRVNPDVVMIPVGDGVTLSGLAKGFREVMRCGGTSKLPRLIGVQAAGCQPLKLAWERNSPIQSTSARTIADGIAVAEPINGVMALRDVRESGGSFIAVSDEQILFAAHMLAAKGGIIAEPAAAAAFAGLEVAQTKGLIQQDETVVILVTGTGLKNPQFFNSVGTGIVYQVHADLHEVEHALTCI